jgi:hypothetical protein
MTKNIRDINRFFKIQSCSPTIQIQINKRLLDKEILIEKQRKRHLRIRNALIKYINSKNEVVTEERTDTDFCIPKKL